MFIIVKLLSEKKSNISKLLLKLNIFNNNTINKSQYYNYSKKFHFNNKSLILTKASTIKTFNSTPTKTTDEKNRIFTIPNYLTTARILMTPVISYLMLSELYSYATALFLIAGFTDFLDGYIARNYKNQKSYLGSILDPVADKFFIGAMAVTLGFCNLLPLEIVLVILGRDLALILSAIIIRFNLIDKPKSIKKFFNIKDHSSVQIEASNLSKLNTFLQIFLIGLTIPSEMFLYSDSIYLKALQYVTASTTVISGLQYLLNKGSYKVDK
jgi:cardiolipin synthase